MNSLKWRLVLCKDKKNHSGYQLFAKVIYLENICWFSNEKIHCFSFVLYQMFNKFKQMCNAQKWN